MLDPDKLTSIDSVLRWVKELFIRIKIFNFTFQSCSAAATTEACSRNINIEDNLWIGCWKNANFHKY